MNVYVELCHSFGLPVWLASLLHAAKRLRSDRARRKKVCRLLHRKLIFHGVGVKKGALRQPTYVYPEEVKMLVRTAFPADICDYPDPCHDDVLFVDGYPSSVEIPNITSYNSFQYESGSIWCLNYYNTQYTS